MSLADLPIDEEPLHQRIPEPEVMSDAEEARVYRQANFAEVNQQFVDRFVELWQARPLCQSPTTGEAVLLDLGCGPADISLRVCRRLTQVRVVGLDASEAMLAEGRPDLLADPTGTRVRLMLADARCVPMPGGSAAAVFSNSLLHHLGDPVPVWQEVRRLAAPGAVIFFRDLYRPLSRRAAAEIVATHAAGEPELLRTLFYNSLLAAFRPEELRVQLAMAGLADLSVQTVTDRHVDIFGYLP